MAEGSRYVSLPDAVKALVRKLAVGRIKDLGQKPIAYK
jgi:hypothetical protein